MATVISYGAAQSVTGSNHLLEVDGLKILIDCGMFQGSIEEENYKAFAYDPKEIDFLLLTHGHIDHIGRVPKLVKEGFNGTIIATKATFDIASIMLLDAAKILNEEYRTLIRKAKKTSAHLPIPKPLYDEEDVADTFKCSRKKALYNTPMKLSENVSITFKEAGHILGSSFIEIDYVQNEQSRRVVFSGDIGNLKRLVIDGLSYGNKAHTLFVESTYGDRIHRNLDESIEEFREVVLETMQRGGSIMIPSFALERTQEILILLKEMSQNGDLKGCRVFLDSPLAIKATNLYNQNPTLLNEENESDISLGENPFSFDELMLTQSVQASMTINDIQSKAIIIAGSGMCTGGRILHHFKHRLGDTNNAVIFVGYQVEGTLGRKIIDGARMINVRGENIAVHAQVHTINGFSAHGDKEDLIDWIKHFEELETTYLIHGEADKLQAFKATLKERLEQKVHIVKRGEHIYI
jgi:metallo-beta-lactamase family protein